ncbi:MAG: hypothetical protein LR011_11780 [Verrucomicrobia bacterium]|nr:hypothetical protein [Verrucomicrobiota bacterium]
MIKSKSNSDETIRNDRNRYHLADGKGSKSKKHRYERRKVREILHRMFEPEDEQATS